MEKQQFNFLAWLTGIVVLTFLFTACFAFVTGRIEWQAFTIAVLPSATGLVGYWIKGAAAK